MSAPHPALPHRPANSAVPASKWSPPVDKQTLELILRKVREWEPVDWNSVFSSLTDILNEDVAPRMEAELPDDDQAEEVAQRFRGALTQLINRALLDGLDRKDPEAALLIEQVRALRAEELPGEPWKNLGLLKRLGGATRDLIDQLVQAGCFSKEMVRC